AIHVLAGGSVEPRVADDAGARRRLAGQQRRVARAGFGDAVALVAVVVDDAFAFEPREPAAQAAAPAVEEGAAELVDRDHDHEVRFLRWRRGGLSLLLLHRRAGAA